MFSEVSSVEICLAFIKSYNELKWPGMASIRIIMDSIFFSVVI